MCLEKGWVANVPFVSIVSYITFWQDSKEEASKNILHRWNILEFQDSTDRELPLEKTDNGRTERHL